MPPVTQPKILSRSQARRWASAARRRGQRIVATNGCFDLIHYGHVRSLQRARRLGDLLIVGVNSDRSTRRLKGPSRPLTPQRQRAAVLAAFACVDAVVIFGELNALRFLAAVHPHIYAKGGDYKPGTLNAEEQVLLKRLGVRVKILPLEPGCSTSALVRKIRASK